MDDKLKKIRHSLAHLLGAAVLELWPDTKLAIGPAVDNGFYYDFDFAKPVTDKDLGKIEQKMREIFKSWKDFKKTDVTEGEAKKIFGHNPYKTELIEEHAKAGDKLTTYTSGEFTDFCAGGHVENMKDVEKDAWKLSRVAGAYWRGDEKNKMLTRIYGLAFATKADLEKYETMIAEAEKRDHRKLGKDLDLFTFSPLVGPGLPLWTPKGTILRNELDNFVWSLREAKGFQKVTIPHLTKKELYETSGHWEKFADSLFKITTREGKEYAVKPMNCPHHTQIFARMPHTYKNMPQRFAETTMVYRDEQSGELGGLTRVLSITQDDAHIFCRHNQIRDEFNGIWDIIDRLYGTFGFELRVRLSFHDPKHAEKYLGTKEIWQNAERELEAMAKARGAKYFLGIGEAAMYGPKLDFMAMDSLGREHQVATIQLDMNLPERFDLSCVNEKGEKERIVMLHCAIMGSIERFSAVLIEHLSGNFPLWLAPVQVKIVPVRDTHNEHAEKIAAELSAAGFRIDCDTSDGNMGKKIRDAKNNKIPYTVIIGDKDIEAGKISVESRDKGQLGQMPLAEFLEKMEKERKEKR
ncbi:MAG: threonine--tRNA ligase [Patescibacteria group bacterium]|nr:threonine--tRNA ligase [Patescibacteria group bacterium]MDE1946137.1 threonine--tRNA ligase [Patescibacteria group bacterium]